MKSIHVPIEGMTCQGCVATVRNVVSALPGVESADVSLGAKEGRFSFDESAVDPETIIDAIEGAGFVTGPPAADPTVDGAACSMTEGVAAAGGADRSVRGANGPERAIVAPNPESRVRLRIGGMSCAACSRTVEKAVTSLPGVSSVVVNVAAEAASVRFDPDRVDIRRIVDAVNRAGYKASLGRNEEVGGGLRDRLWLLWTVALALPIVLIQQGRLHPPVEALTLVALATALQFTSGWRFYRGAWYSLRAGTANMDVLVALGISAAYGYSILVVSFPGLFGGAHTFFETAATLILFIRVGKMLEASARGKADDALRALIRLKPITARRLMPGGGEEEVSVSDVAVGDLVRLRPGDSMPVDGVVEEGTSSVDESSVTGESIPVRKERRDAVTGGTTVIDGNLTVRATAVGENTFLSGMVRLVEEAQLDKAPIQRFADRVSGVFVPIVILLATITFAVWQFLLHSSLPFSLARAVAVLVVACPCALGLATPTAILVGTGVGLRRGILFKRGSVLERIARVNTILFDKTGTITEGKPVLTGEAFSKERSEEDVLGLAAAGAARSNHPLSKAIVVAASERGFAARAVSGSEEIPGIGVKFVVGGSDCLLGNKRLMRENDVDTDGFEEQVKKWEGEGRTVVYLASGGATIGVFALRDEPREGVTDAIARIENAGIRTVLVTGDRKRTAEGIAAHIGLGSVHAEVLPEGKAALVEEVRREGGVVAMVGDGINDAPALARADVGIAVGAGTDVAKETGDVVLIRSDPSDVASAIELGRATLGKIRQNLFWALIYNILAIPLAAGVFARWGLLMSPEAAAAAMAFSSISVVLNSLDLKRWRPVAA